MTRLTCPFLFCCAIASLTTAGLADLSNTNSTAPSDAPAARLPADPPSAPDAPRQTAPTPAPSPPDLADTNSTLASAANQPESDTNLEIRLQLAQRERHDKSFIAAAQVLESILKTNAPPALQRQALFDLAEVMQDDGQSAKAQQIWSQYLQIYPQDPAVPDVLLRQGLLYRKMGVDEFAISKFYAVMSTALKLKLDNLAYYKKLVVQAQTEIADTYYLDSKFEEAADFFSRILKSGDAEANREQLEWKLIRSLSYLTNHTETIARAQSFLSRFPSSSNLPEVRFLLARALTNMKRNPDAMQQVLLLLQSQQDNVSRDPETWAYWQRRAGNEIANQLYKEGDNVDALQIYLSLAQLDPSPLWQVPVLYQVGMAYEQLQQWQKATDTYTRILDRQKQLNTNATPTLALVVDMAQWRKDYIAWMQKARLNSLALRPLEPAGPAAPAVP
ncbi:MAG TPA: tetratricopeptide repeat protein [Candidatus Acidoferrum sp.]|nr:tetratricopeptide repeat protein [Candidatus Acidoferrum sp.]